MDRPCNWRARAARGRPAPSKAILDALSSRGQEIDIFDRHLALGDASVGGPLTFGNQMLLHDEPATYRAMFAAILAARPPCSYVRWQTVEPRWSAHTSVLHGRLS